jgi:hypothetical protein
MPRYPTQQAQILALAEAMIGGYTEHAAMFPNSDVALLQGLRDAYDTTAAAQTEAMATAQIATEAKQAALAQLHAVIKRQLKQSQIDSADNPENLNYIGWGPRTAEQPLTTPGQPMALKSVSEGAGTLEIGWKRPARGSGGRVQTYIIERRELMPDESEKGATFTDWRHAGISLETKATLKDQPRGVQLEYRIKAINKSGESEASNTIAVVL